MELWTRGCFLWLECLAVLSAIAMAGSWLSVMSNFFVNDGGAMAPDMVVLYVSFPPSTTLMSSSYVLMEKETADAKLQCL